MHFHGKFQKYKDKITDKKLFCGALTPTSTQTICEGLVETYLPDLLEQLAEGADPYTVCSSGLLDLLCKTFL